MRLRMRRAAIGAASCALLFGVALPLSHAAGAARTHVVIIEAMQYSPSPVEAAVGDVVVWKNKDPFPHTVTADDRSFRSFDSHQIAAGGSWKFKVRKKGSFSYVCTYHPTMKGQLIVK